MLRDGTCRASAEAKKDSRSGRAIRRQERRSSSCVFIKGNATVSDVVPDSDQISAP